MKRYEKDSEWIRAMYKYEDKDSDSEWMKQCCA